MKWMIAVTLLSLILAGRWAYVAHRALKTLAKFEQYKRGIALIFKDIHTEVQHCITKVPLAYALELYILEQRLADALEIIKEAK